MIYEVPFTYPAGLSLLTLNRMLTINSLTIHPSSDQLDNGLPRNVGRYFITGTQENLISFFREIDGPSQSFPVAEFVEYIQDYILES
jgi:hypothetical protein